MLPQGEKCIGLSASVALQMMDFVSFWLALAIDGLSLPPSMAMRDGIA